MDEKAVKAETLKNLIGMHEKLDATRSTIKQLDNRVSALEQNNGVEHRQFKNQIKRTTWEVSKLATGHRKDIEEHSHRLTDTKERLDNLSKIVDWTIYTILGLFVTTVVAGILKFTLFQ